ncbi:CLUMA_CG012321, isoform A [Clunio marinus]|uniref:CLUMA_CG012321, isoform A n=1 Tax=Clunio marinus TaxID=568069 RepID=A0A1J1IEL7_9DIPT|nr:CLUMA_CG012321, isoform A [Clunio marinus]
MKQILQRKNGKTKQTSRAQLLANKKALRTHGFSSENLAHFSLSADDDTCCTILGFILRHISFMPDL